MHQNKPFQDQKHQQFSGQGIGPSQTPTALPTPIYTPQQCLWRLHSRAFGIRPLLKYPRHCRLISIPALSFTTGTLVVKTKDDEC